MEDLEAEVVAVAAVDLEVVVVVAVDLEEEVVVEEVAAEAATQIVEAATGPAQTRKY